MSGRSLGEDTIATYMRVAKLLERHRGHVGRLLKPDLSHSTKQKYVAGLRQWAVFTEDDELQARLRPGAALQRLLSPRQSRLPQHIEAFTDEEVRALLGVLDVMRGEPPLWIWPSVSLQIHLGLRVRADLVGVRREAVQNALTSGRLAVMGKRDRIDHLPARFVADELQELLSAGSWDIVADIISPESSESSDYEHRKAAYRVYRREILALGKSVGLDTGRTHRFRHWAITRYHREVARGDIVKTMRFARHKRLETTLRYVHSSDLEDDDERLAEIKRLR